MSRRALVTGSTGFIGGALTRRLVQDGWEVHSVVRPSSSAKSIAELRTTCRLHTHDGTTGQLMSIMRHANPDTVFHVASRVLAEHEAEDVEDLIRSNVLFSTQLVEAMIRGGCRRLVNAGTSWQHYQTNDYRPVNLYAATKQAFSDVLVYYRDAHDLSVVTLELFNVYGPGDRRRRLIDVLVEAAVSGATLALSPGEQIVDLTHVDDVASAFLTAARLLGVSSEPLYDQFLVSGERFSIRELVEVVEHATGRVVNVRFGGRAYRCREVMVPVLASEKLLDWSPRIRLAKFLESLRPVTALAPETNARMRVERGRKTPGRRVGDEESDALCRCPSPWQVRATERNASSTIGAGFAAA